MPSKLSSLIQGLRKTGAADPVIRQKLKGVGYTEEDLNNAFSELGVGPTQPTVQQTEPPVEEPPKEPSPETPPKQPEQAKETQQPQQPKPEQEQKPPEQPKPEPIKQAPTKQQPKKQMGRFTFGLVLNIFLIVTFITFFSILKAQTKQTPESWTPLYVAFTMAAFIISLVSATLFHFSHASIKGMFISMFILAVFPALAINIVIEIINVVKSNISAQDSILLLYPSFMALVNEMPSSFILTSLVLIAFVIPYIIFFFIRKEKNYFLLLVPVATIIIGVIIFSILASLVGSTVGVIGG